MERPDDAKGPDGSGARRGGDDLERRRSRLDAELSARKPVADDGPGGRTGTVTGIGNALRLSSEFIAGVVVGAGIGWFFDRMAGTAPWGLIVFLLLGFAAGVVNALRSAGLVAEVGSVSPGKRAGTDDRKE